MFPKKSSPAHSLIDFFYLLEFEFEFIFPPAVMQITGTGPFQEGELLSAKEK